MTSTKRFHWISVALVAGVMLAACSGGNGAGGSALTPAVPEKTVGASAHRARGSIQITIRIPHKKWIIPVRGGTQPMRHRPKYISASTKSMTVATTAGPTQTFNLTPNASGCSAPGSTLTCTVIAFSPAGKQTLTITLYDRKNGQGDALSTASTSANVKAGATTTISITLNGVVATATVLVGGSSSATIPVGTPTSLPMSVTAYDADKNIIMSPGNYTSPVTLADSDSTGSTSLSTTSVTAPGSVVTLSYNGGTFSSVTITPSVNGTAQPSGAVTVTLVSNPTMTEYTATSLSEPTFITSGPLGALWFSEPGIDAVGKITTSGTITDYSIPTAKSSVAGITAGPNGTVWFAEEGTSKIGEMTFTGSTPTIAEYSAGITSGSGPNGITEGPNGALWFTELTHKAIGQITTAGTVVGEYTTTSAASQPYDIVTGSDGNLWFTESAANNIGKSTTTGAITEYSIPTASSYPYCITSGPDGALWFTEFIGNHIGKIATDGTITEYSIPTASSYPYCITSGPDGALWFTEFNGNNIGRITTGGTITEYSLPTASSLPNGITTGPDGAIWFTEEVGRIGRITGIAPALAGRRRHRLKP